MIALSGTTKVCMSLGFPIRQSLSPAVQTAAFQARGLDYVYVPWGVRSEDLEVTMRALRASETYAGGNATAPHKEVLMRLLDGVTPAAARVGAINVIFRQGEDLIGDTSDGPGYVAALREAGIEPGGLRVLMIGAGGAARAVGLALADAGAASIRVLNRAPERAEAVADLIAAVGTAEASAGPIAAVAESLEGVDLLVNATSLGLQPGAGPLFDYAVLRPPLIVSDLVFLPSETPFLHEARLRGCRTLNGVGMLLHQAVLSFERWTGEAAPADVMRRVLTETLAARENAARAA